jgi:hypothetical protein
MYQVPKYEYSYDSTRVCTSTRVPWYTYVYVHVYVHACMYVRVPSAIGVLRRVWKQKFPWGVGQGCCPSAKRARAGRSMGFVCAASWFPLLLLLHPLLLTLLTTGVDVGAARAGTDSTMPPPRSDTSSGALATNTTANANNDNEGQNAAVRRYVAADGTVFNFDRRTRQWQLESGTKADAGDAPTLMLKDRVRRRTCGRFCRRKNHSLTCVHHAHHVCSSIGQRGPSHHFAGRHAIHRLPAVRTHKRERTRVVAGVRTEL